MAGENIQELIIAVKANTEQLGKLTTDLGKVVGGLDKTADASKRAAGEFSKFVEDAANLKIVIDGVLGVFNTFKDAIAGVANAVGDLAANEVRLVSFSKTIGLTREEIGGLSEGIKDLGGNPEAALRGITKLGGEIQDALSGKSKEAADKLELLGVKLDSLRNSANPVSDAIRQIGASTKGTALTLEQSQAASDLLGRSFKDLVGAAQTLDENIASIQKKGQILSPSQSEGAIKAFAALDDVSDSIEGLVTQFLVSLLPAIQDVNKEIATVIETLSQDEEFTAGFNALRGVAQNFISKDVPGIIRGVARITEAFVENGEKLAPYLDALRNIASLGFDVDELLDARAKIDKAVAKNLEFLRLYNSGLSEQEKLSKAAALGIQAGAATLEAFRKSLKGTKEDQDEVFQSQADGVQKISDAAKEASAEINKTRQAETLFLKEQLAAQLIDFETYNLEIIDLAISTAEDQVEISQKALDQIVANTEASSEQIAKAQEDLNKALEGLADARIKKNKLEADLAKGLKEDQEEATEAAVEAKEAIEETAAAIENVIPSVNDLGGAIEAVDNRISDAAKAAQGLNAILNEVAESVRFVGDPDSLDDLNDKLAELQASLIATQKEIFEEGKLGSVTLNAQVAILEDAIAGLEARIREVIFQKQQDAFKAANEARIAAQQEMATRIAEIEAKLQKELADLAQQQRRLERKADKETETQQNKAAQQRIEAKEKENQAIADENERFRQEQADKDQQDKDEALRREEEFAERAAKIRSDAKRDNLQAETDAFVEITSLQNQLRDLQDQLKEGGLSTEDEARLLAEQAKISQQLAEAQAKETARATAAKEKQAKIDKAIAEGGTEEELNAKIDAIEAEEQLEKDRNAAILALGKNATKEQIAEVNRRFAELKQLLQDDLAAQLKLFAAQEAARVKQRADERAADQQAHADRLADAQKAYQDEIEAINSRNGEILAAIGKRLDDELKAIRKQRKDVEAEARAQTAAVLEQFRLSIEAANKFITELGKGYDSLIGKIDKLIAKQKEVDETAKRQTGSDDQTSNRTIGQRPGGGPASRGAANQSPAGGSQPGSGGIKGADEVEIVRGAGKRNAADILEGLVQLIGLALDDPEALPNLRDRGRVGVNQSLGVTIQQILQVPAKVSAETFLQMTARSLLNGDAKLAVKKSVRELNKAVADNDIFESRGSLTPPVFNRF